MTKVKISSIGLKDMLYFKGRPKNREKHIMSSPLTPLIPEYEVNKKAAERHPNSQEFVIEKIIERGENVKSFVLRKKDGTLPAFFRAGQYVVIRQMIEGKLIARPVSISSGPLDALNGTYTITVKRVPDGFLSIYILDNWKVGDTVITSGPQGTFYYEGLRDAKDVVAVAGGSGITPILSMAQAILSGDENFNLTILYGSRDKSDMLFSEEFAEITSKTNKVRIINVLSEEEDPSFEHGFIDANLIKKYAPDKQYSLFAAGPQAMYRFLDGEASKLGFNNKFYRKELFGSAKEPWKVPGYPQEIKDKVFSLRIKICDKEYTIPCSANENILVAMERAGVAGPNRCRGGVCGYCRSKLLKGDVFIPEDTDGRRQADKVYGYIHPCASFALSDLYIEVPFNK